MIFTYVIDYKKEGRTEIRRHNQMVFEEWSVENNDQYILDMLKIIKKRIEEL